MILVFCLTTIVAAASPYKFWCDVPNNVDASAQVPAGFCVRRFATIRAARTLDFVKSTGDVLVGAPASGTPGGSSGGIGGVFALYDDNGDGVADNSNNVFLTGESTFHGIRVIGDYLYYSESERVLRVPFKAGDRKKTPANAVPEIVADLSSGGGGDRFTHTIDAHPLTGEIFVTTGRYDESACTTAATRVGAVLRIGARAASVMGDIVVGRCRNPMYMRCKSFGCYVMELSGDSWTGVGGTEKLVAIVNNTDIGFPCCIQPNKPTGEFGADCSKITKQIADFPLTDTPFGFDWDDKRQWPAPYTGRLFIGNHGSFYSGSSGNPAAFEDAGIITLEWDYVNKRPVANTTAGVAGIYPQFVPNGWGGAGKLGERPTDVMFHPDGRLFLADDYTGHILWIAPTNLMTNGTFVPPEDVPTTAPTSATPPTTADSTVSTTGGGEATTTASSVTGSGATTPQATTSGSSSVVATNAAAKTAPFAVAMFVVSAVFVCTVAF